MDKTSGRNFVIRFFPKYLAIDQKSSKTVIPLEGKPISSYPFRLFLLSLGPTYGQDITAKEMSKLVILTRQSQKYLTENIPAAFGSSALHKLSLSRGKSDPGTNVRSSGHR